MAQMPMENGLIIYMKTRNGYFQTTMKAEQFFAVLEERLDNYFTPKFDELGRRINNNTNAKIEEVKQYVDAGMADMKRYVDEKFDAGMADMKQYVNAKFNILKKVIEKKVDH